MKRRLPRWLAAESGQMLPLIALLSALVLAMGGICIDVGHAFICKRELQTSADAAALAGAWALTATNATAGSVQSLASAYSSARGNKNANPAFTSVTVSTTLKCLNTVSNWGVFCSGSNTGNNAVQVLETATIDTWFIRLASVFGVASANTLTIQAESTAAMRSGGNDQYNVAIVLDTTGSMNNIDHDANCGNTEIYCALQGLRVLLQSLSPCGPSSTASNCVPFDQVSLFTFPNVLANTAQYDTTCSGWGWWGGWGQNSPTTAYYSTPGVGANWSAPSGSSPTYQITGYLSDYSKTNKPNGGLNPNSALGIAAGGSGKYGCPGLQAATSGVASTYYAGAIYAAQSSLIAARAANPGSKNAMVILTDAGANTTQMTNGRHNGNTYPSLDSQCAQGIAAAAYAKSQGTTVYTVSYGAASNTGPMNNGCTTDPALSPCSTLKQMASAPGNFYSDATSEENTGQCISPANPNLNLNQIFRQISTQLTFARLIPNDTR